MEIIRKTAAQISEPDKNFTQFILTSRLQEKVICTNDFEEETRFRKKTDALKYRYIALNQLYRSFIVIDVDSPNGAFNWEWSNVPEPTITTINPDSGRCHFIYALDKPVIFTDKGREKPQDFFKAVSFGLTEQIKGADSQYVGLFTKNPLHSDWKILVSQRIYDLSYLSEFVKLKPAWERKKTFIENSQGRNCSLFDTVRFWAYREVNNYKAYEQFYRAVEIKAVEVNQNFNDSLPFNEIKNTAKSIAKYTWLHKGCLSEYYEPKNRGIMQLSKELDLKERQSLGGTYGRRKYQESVELKIRQAIEDLESSNQKISRLAICRKSGVSLDAVERYVKINPF